MNPHCTNPYFLAKMAGEVALFRSGLAVTVLRPSYIFGAGDEFLSPLIRRMLAETVVEIPGRGDYRLQPISVEDAARAIRGALDGAPASSSRVVDLVGPEIVSYRTLVERIASIMGRRVEIRERPVGEALAQARATGYFGLRPHDLACLLCDEVSDHAPVEALVGRPLETLDHMLERAIATVSGRGGE
jgi:NADH dehydrogenase